MRPLTARSVVLSLLLGSHPDRLSARELTRAGEHFGIAAATVRVALTRCVAAGDLRRDGADYVLGERLVARQRRQDEAVEDAATPWDGAWELAVVVVSGRSGTARATLRDQLAGARLAELREGVWTRPANLRRPASYAAQPVLRTFRSVPDQDPAQLAATLWDLASRADAGRTVVARLAAAREPAERLVAAAELVRHVTDDPLLPAELLPDPWPGPELRTAYAAYQEELRELAQLPHPSGH